MTPRISSYWLYFVTATSYVLAKNLVNSMKTEVICQPNNLVELLQISLIDYNTAIKLAFDKIEQNQVISSWKDAQTSNVIQRRHIALYRSACQWLLYRYPQPQAGACSAFARQNLEHWWQKEAGITATGCGKSGAF